jgi:hypothetical protein
MDALHCVYADASSEYSAAQMIYYTPHMCTDVLHCVCADVSSDYSAAQMIYYTPHMCTDALHCVCADVSSEYSAPQTTYYTPHMCKDDHHYITADIHSKYSVNKREGTIIHIMLIYNYITRLIFFFKCHYITYLMYYVMEIIHQSQALHNTVNFRVVCERFCVTAVCRKVARRKQ